MSANGLNLAYEHDFYPGIFTELNPYDNPVTTLVGQKGIRVLPQKAYTYTTHSNLESSSVDAKPDNASPTYGSSTFSNGSNTVQILYRGAQVSWARMGEQNLGRTLGWQGQSNPSREEDPMDRAIAEALGNMKSDLEWVSREGLYNLPQDGTTSGTTGTWQQRGYRYAPGINNKLADGAVAGAGTLGTLGTLTFDVVRDALESAWQSRLWTGGNNLVCFTNSTGKKQLTDIFVDNFNMGKNGESRTEAGVNLLNFVTDFGGVDIALTHNMPQDTMYFLNTSVMELVARPVPGKGVFFTEDFGQGNEKANRGKGVYAEIGMDHGVGSTHIRLTGVGSTVIGGQTVSAT